jgi:hypothetical protein
MSYSDSTVRQLTIAKSKANIAHNAWYNELTPIQRFEIGQKVDCKLSGLNKLNACLNYVEDNLEQFTY